MNLQEIFSRVLHMSLTGSYIILVVLLIRLALRKAPKIFSYVLWAVVLFRLLCPVSISSALSVLNFAPVAEQQPQGPVTTVEHPVILDIYQGTSVEPKPHDLESDHQTHISDSSIPENRVDAAPVPDAGNQQAAAEPVRDPLSYAVTIWLLGIAAMFVYNICTYFRLGRHTTGAVRLRKNIYLGDHIPTPFVKGLFRPRIYLPSTLSEAERKYIIAHERCHIRRKDPIWKLLGYIALCIHWFNPLVWLAFVQSTKDMEMSCDEAVIAMYGPKIRAEYSASLLRLATGHRFVALTPLAFGKGDTKGRVMNMAKWKKPGFWAMLCAAIVCIAVLAACATNPSEKEPQTETTEQAETNETTSPAAQPTETLLQITEAEADKLCADALEQLKNAESYYILYDYPNLYNSESRETMEYRRHGNNLLAHQPAATDLLMSYLYYDGIYANFLGDYWMKDEQPMEMDANGWLEKWSMEGKEINEISVSGNTVTFQATWPYAMDPSGEYRGSFTYTLNNDGSLNSIQREYILYIDNGETSPVIDSITVREEDAEATYAAIKAVADQCVTQAELEELRYQEKLVSEIPSNKTQYDQNFALGAGQMGWYFHNEEYFCKLGCENPTATGVTVYHTEAAQVSVKVVAEENYWLEVFEDGKWRYVDENIKEVRDEVRSVSIGFYDGDKYTLDWSDSYGALKPGFYRVGRYYTVSLPGKGEDTQVCYAKFRLYDPNQELLIQKCRSAMAALQESKAYHIRSYALIDNTNFICFNTDTWKYGSNYLSYSENTAADGSLVFGGTMYRGGKGYSLSWQNDKVTEPLRNWSTLDFVDEGHFLSWKDRMEFYDSKVIGAEEKDNQISVYMEYDFHDNAYTKTEFCFTFHEDGSLAGAKKIGYCHDGSTVLEASMEVLDTPAEEINSMIESQDVSKPPVFSWAEDKDKYPNAKTDGFKNTAKSSVKSMEDALWLADKECTMPPQDVLAGERYNIVEIAYDPDACIWRVYLRYSQNIDGDQIIYINDDGITVMIVTT